MTACANWPLAARRLPRCSWRWLAPRLRAVGVLVPDHEIAQPSHRLYALLAAEHADSAHGRYNALVARLVSFAHSAEVSASNLATAPDCDASV